MESVKRLACQGGEGCVEPVTHADNKGFIYCTFHGEARRNVKPCRRLLRREIAKLERGEPIWWDKSKN